MSKIFRRIAAITMAAVLIALAPMSTAEAATKIEAPKTVTAYADSTMGYGFSVNYVKKTDKVSSLRISDKSMILMNDINRSVWQDEKGKDVNCININFRAVKPGKATISYKIAGKTYKTTVKVNKYSNPIKVANIFGAKNDDGSTNLASETAESASATLFPDEAPTSKKVSFTVASGWKITGIEVRKIGIGPDEWNDEQIAYAEYWNKPASKASLTLKEAIDTENGYRYAIWVNLYNPKTDAWRNVEYNIYY